MAHLRRIFQNEKTVSMSVVIIAKDAGSAKAAIAPLHVVHFHPSVFVSFTQDTVH